MSFMTETYSFLFTIYVVIISSIFIVHILSLIIQFFQINKLKRLGGKGHNYISKNPFSKKSKTNIPKMRLVKLIISFTLVFILTFYAFINSYAVLTNTNIPRVNAVQKLADEIVIRELLTNRYVHEQSADEVGRERKLTVMKIPRLNTRIDMLKIIEKDDTYLLRPNSSHYMFIGDDSYQNPEYLIVYMDANWRTIPIPLDVAVGDNIFLQKDNNEEAMFRIRNVRILDFGKEYIPTVSDKLQLILVIQDRNNKINYIFEGEYIDTNINRFEFSPSR
jgi:hypothetical protein